MRSNYIFIVKMRSKDNHDYEFRTITSNKEQAIKNAYKKIEDNLWAVFNYKTVSVERKEKYVNKK